MENDLLKVISKQLNIPKTQSDEWVCQCVYSVAGQMALASLWDRTEDGCPIAVSHFKKRAERIFEAYESIYPEIRTWYPKNKTALIAEMYAIYLRTGFIYQAANQIAPAPKAVTLVDGTVLHRDTLPASKPFMSGLGFYSETEKKVDVSAMDIFGLPSQDLESYLRELRTDDEWEPADWPEGTEFLKLTPPFTKGYWQDTPLRAALSMARYGVEEKEYVLYRYKNGKYEKMRIPLWRVRDCFSDDPANCFEYRRIAIAILKEHEALPPIKAKKDGGLVEVHLGYRLPPPEEYFFKLYSWPVRYNFSSPSSQVFVRKMSEPAYHAFKQVMKQLGYTFAM